MERDRQVISEVSKFWNIENIGESEIVKISPDYDASINLIDNRYYVEPPRKPNSDLLPDNFSLSLSRLNLLYNRLKREPKKLEEYDYIIKTQIR